MISEKCINQWIKNVTKRMRTKNNCSPGTIPCLYYFLILARLFIFVTFIFKAKNKMPCQQHLIICEKFAKFCTMMIKGDLNIFYFFYFLCIIVFQFLPLLVFLPLLPYSSNFAFSAFLEKKKKGRNLQKYIRNNISLTHYDYLLTKDNRFIQIEVGEEVREDLKGEVSSPQSKELGVYTRRWEFARRICALRSLMEEVVITLLSFT